MTTLTFSWLSAAKTAFLDISARLLFGLDWEVIWVYNTVVRCKKRQ